MKNLTTDFIELILDNYLIIKKKYTDSIDYFLEENLKANQSILAVEKANFKLFLQTMDNYQKIAQNHKTRNLEESIDFNPLSFFKIDEPKHSFLIAYLLNPRESHGQGNLFLKKFLEKAKVENSDKLDWVVTAETNRIDIMIRRKFPNSTIIIENKSHNAIDQPNQLYRYWYYHIYEHQSTCTSEEIEKRYQLIYLAPSENKQVSENSITRPSFLEDKRLPDKIPLPIKKWGSV